jgi:hypothetical protein
VKLKEECVFVDGYTASVPANVDPAFLFPEGIEVSPADAFRLTREPG